MLYSLPPELWGVALHGRVLVVQDVSGAVPRDVVAVHVHVVREGVIGQCRHGWTVVLVVEQPRHEGLEGLWPVTVQLRPGALLGEVPLHEFLVGWVHEDCEGPEAL